LAYRHGCYTYAFKITPGILSLVMETRTYRCRDCGFILSTVEPINKCPQCGSLYLIPKALWALDEPKKQKLTFFHRLMLLVLGSFLSLVSIFVITTYTSLLLAVNFGFSISGSIKLALAGSVIVGIYGFIMAIKNWLNSSACYGGPAVVHSIMNIRMRRISWIWISVIYHPI